MFPQLKKINNESGVVLFIVLMTAIIIMIVSLSILTQSMNETNYAQQQCDQIAAEELSKGIFWNAYSQATQAGGGMQNVGISTTPQGRTYQVSGNTVLGSPVPGTVEFNVATNYDTFQ